MFYGGTAQEGSRMRPDIFRQLRHHAMCQVSGR